MSVDRYVEQLGGTLIEIYQDNEIFILNDDEIH